MSAVDRRSVLGGSASLVAASLLWSDIARGAAAVPPAASLRLLTRVCDLVIPRTSAPGAVDAKVPGFVALALKHGLEGTLGPKALGAPVGNDYLGWLGSALGKDFMAQPPRVQTARLTQIDAAAYAPNAAPSPWRTLKALILIGYFTSEAGATKALRYVPLPGRFDPDLQLKPGTKSISNDWTAVDFG